MHALTWWLIILPVTIAVFGAFWSYLNLFEFDFPEELAFVSVVLPVVALIVLGIIGIVGQASYEKCHGIAQEHTDKVDTVRFDMDEGCFIRPNDRDDFISEESWRELEKIDD